MLQRRIVSLSMSYCSKGSNHIGASSRQAFHPSVVHGLHSSPACSSSSSTQHRGTSFPAPIKKHKREVTSLERAAAIGLEALQESQQQQELQRLQWQRLHPQQMLQQQWRQQQRLPAAAMQGPLAGGDLLLPEQQRRPRKRVGECCYCNCTSCCSASASALKDTKRAVKVNDQSGGCRELGLPAAAGCCGVVKSAALLLHMYCCCHSYARSFPYLEEALHSCGSSSACAAEVHVGQACVPGLSAALSSICICNASTGQGAQ